MTGYKLFLTGIAIIMIVSSAFCANDRPLIFGQNPIGTDVWGYDKNVYDPMEFDKIAASGGACCRIGVNWDVIEPVRGTRNWAETDRWVKYCVDRGINPIILINSTPTWALPAVNDIIPVPQARYAPRPDCLPDFDSFVFELVHRYRGLVQFYEFWNEANGYGWHWDGGWDRADEYVPLMIHAYKQIKLADPTAKMSLTGIDDNAGDGDNFIQKVYDNGGKGYFDAVADHPYSKNTIEEWKLNDVRNKLDSNGDFGVDIWITEMGWTAKGRESTIAGYITDYFDKLVNNHPTVKIATYHTAMDFPQEDYGYGLIDKNFVTKPTWTAFSNYPKPARPVVSGVTVTKLSASSVRINFNTNLPAKALVMYGQTDMCGMVSNKDTSLSTSHQFTLTGLVPATTYNYRIRVGAVDYGDAYAADAVFTTDAGQVVHILTGPTVSSVTDTSATVSWTTDISATAQIQYGKDFGYGTSLTRGTTATSHSFTLTNLTPGTNYQFKVFNTASGYADGAQEGIPFTTVSPTKIVGYTRTLTGAVIPGTTVTASPGSYTATADSTGYFEITGVPLGTYTVVASKQGFIDSTKSVVVRTSGANTYIDFNMGVATPGIQNPGFEDTYTNSPDSSHQLPRYWTEFAVNGSPQYAGLTGNRHSGAKTFSFSGTSWTAGLYQRCGAIVGTKYSASVWVAGFQDSGGTTGSTSVSFLVGIDPTGGLDPTASTVQWSSVYQPGASWKRISVQASAVSNGITVFIGGYNTTTQQLYGCFDDVTLDGPGSITGTVRESTGSVIPGTSVFTTPGNYTVQTDANGAYAINSVPSGTYTVTASSSGYTSSSVNNVAVSVGGSARADITLLDASAPSVPTVTDEGDYTLNLSQLYASWSSTDPETGVSEYQYAVRNGTGTYVVNWTSAGTSTSAAIPATLTEGVKYYIDVKARNNDGLWSAVGSSDGVTARSQMTIAAAKGKSDGTEVYVSGVVTAKFDEGGALRFYVENADRSCGIGVLTTSSVTVGDLIRVCGNITNLNGERLITFGVPSTIQSGVTVPTPIFLISRELGGDAMGFQTALLDKASGNMAAVGLNNVGLLVNVWGRVTYVDAGGSFFYVDDGSGIMDNPDYLGVRVACTGMSAPTVRAVANVKGVSATALIGGRAVRLIRPRSMSDLTYLSN